MELAFAHKTEKPPAINRRSRRAAAHPTGTFTTDGVSGRIVALTTKLYHRDSPASNCQQSSAGVQLPHTEVIHQAPVQSPAPAPITAPPPFTRWEWVKKMTRLHKLTLPQRSVLLEHVFHAGTDKGSTVSSKTLAEDLGCTDRTVRTANSDLVEKGLLSRRGRTSQTAYFPNYNSGKSCRSEPSSTDEVLPNCGKSFRSTAERASAKKKEKRNMVVVNDLIDHVNHISFPSEESTSLGNGDACAREELRPGSGLSELNSDGAIEDVPEEVRLPVARICPACGDGGFSAPAGTGCGLVYESRKVSFLPAEDLPRWYQQFARKVDPLNLPEYRDINEAAMLAGWSDKTLERAALTYTRHYATQRVTDPVALFRKLVIDAKGKDSAKAPVGRKDQGRKFQEDSLRRRR